MAALPAGAATGAASAIKKAQRRLRLGFGAPDAAFELVVASAGAAVDVGGEDTEEAEVVDSDGATVVAGDGVAEAG